MKKLSDRPVAQPIPLLVTDDRVQALTIRLQRCGNG